MEPNGHGANALAAVDVCIVGGGPAGAVIAARLAQLGADVVLVERSAFPRAHLGESLSPGVLSLLETIGARRDVEEGGFVPVRSVLTNWDGTLGERVDAGEQGLLVDRGRFDELLLRRARALGVRVLQPAFVSARERRESEWLLSIQAAEATTTLRARFLVDATGRSAWLPGKRRRTAPRTLALYAYWRGRSLPDRPRIEAGSTAWYWGVPLPDGSYNTLVFVDGDSLRDGAYPSVRARFRALLARSGLMEHCVDAELSGSVHAADATPYLDEESVTSVSLKVGDAALVIDPLSSSGVQKAIQSALAGAIVVNTLLRRPEAADVAMQFYRESLSCASHRHCGWAASHYATVQARTDSPFWTDRASGAVERDEAPTGSLAARIASNEPIALCPRLEIVSVPRLGAEYVEVGPALRHPGLETPVGYLGGWELAPLVHDIRTGMTPLQVVHTWSPRVPLKSGIAITGWLLRHGILVSYPGAPSQDACPTA